jgi:hypothetical protein
MTTMTDRYLICTDLGRTLIPNGPQPESRDARKRFAALAARPEVTLAYVTGRQRALIEDAIVTYRLPTPDFVIGDVGTTICRVGPELAWTHLDTWEEQIATDWGGHTHGELRALLRDIPALRLQERSRQSRLKLSFYLPLYVEVDELTAAIRARLEPLGMRTRLIWSVDDIADVSLLDVLRPAPASCTRSRPDARKGFAPARRCSAVTAATTSKCWPAKFHPCWCQPPGRAGPGARTGRGSRHPG